MTDSSLTAAKIAGTTTAETVVNGSNNNISKKPLCLDCTTNPATHTIRRRCLCPTCLQRFVASKILKRLEGINPRSNHKTKTNAKPSFLVPISGGVSSVTLLAVLCAHLRRQTEKTGRTAYDLVAFHVDVDDDGGAGRRSERWSNLEHEFPECQLLTPLGLSQVFTVDSNVYRDLSSLGLEQQEAEGDVNFLIRLFTSARSATARSELREILLKRLVVAVAKQHDCDGILWGHSDTKLAAMTLSLVAKGRGASVASEMADGSILWDLKFAYPSRDLYKAELQMYLDCEPGNTLGHVLETEKAQQSAQDPVASLRGISIDDLLSNYIGKEGEKYPSIMTNVVRTSGKLVASNEPGNQTCRLCAAQVNRDGDGEQLLCYGCQRMKQDIKV